MARVIQLGPETVSEFALCDAQLLGIDWQEGGRDLHLRLKLGSGATATLECAWADSLDIELSTGPGSGGFPLSFGCQCRQVSPRWELHIEFPPHGHVRMRCSSALLRTHEDDADAS